jgi:ABC-type transporter Mla subunit MlaD
MFFRRSRARRARDAVADQVAERTDDLAAALEAAREAIAKASTAAGRKGAELGKKSAVKGKQARRRGAKAAREVAEVLPEPEQVADLTRRAADKLFPERAKQRRNTSRRRRRRLLFGGAGLLGAGVVAGWLTAPKRGAETRQALKDQAAKASEKGWERVAEPPEAAGMPQQAGEQGAEVTQLHHGDGAVPKPSRTPPG